MVTKELAEQPARRKSLLPQRSSVRHALTSMSVVAELPIPKAERLRTNENNGSHHEQRPSTKITSGMPVPNFERFSSLRQTTKLSSLRRPSTLQEAFPAPALRKVNGTAKADIESSARVSHHGRSVSHQLHRSAVPGASSRTPIDQQPPANRQKPAFTAMQRSFTPKKVVRSRSSSSCSQPTSRDDVSSVDAFHLQIDLAQLHLLHRSAHAVQSQWERSAQTLLHNRFDAITERHVELKEISQQQQTLIDGLSLVQWSQSQSGAQLADKVRLLSRIIADVCSLTDSDGKYTRILGVFESWFTQALETREHRKPGLMAEEASVNFIESIGDGWKAEAMVLERELVYYLRDLKAFGSIRPNSSLGRIHSLYTKLITNLIEEIDLMQWAENEISVQERFWVKSTIQRLALDVNHDIESMVFPDASANRLVVKYS